MSRSTQGLRDSRELKQIQIEFQRDSEMTTQPDSPCVLTEIRGNSRTMDVPVLSSIIASLGDWRQAVPVIISLVIIEGLLSVDNALAIAAMARHLPEAQRIRALRFGIIGAYFFVEFPWRLPHGLLKILG